MGVVKNAREEGVVVSDGVMSRVPVPTPTETHILECRSGYHMSVSPGGPKFTHGLPMTSTIHDIL